jgi:A/G-specific adenine glycosylase
MNSSFKKLISWSKDNYSHLPWRKKRTLYRTLVSEIMLQQTTVGTVLSHFEKFLIQFPDLETLSAATEDELTIAWKGLGYYRRARNLKKASEEIVHSYNGKIPSDYDKLIKIPGIGDYTASALIAIGRNEKALALDANLSRVLSRYFGFSFNDSKEIQKNFQQSKIFSNFSEDWRDLNEALMDLGRTYCKANKADCSLCPLSDTCLSFKKGTIVLNKDTKKETKFYELTLLRLVIKKEKKILVYKKAKNEWLSGQYEVPTFQLFCEDTKLKQYVEAPRFERETKKLLSFKTGITKYDITNIIWEMSEKEFKKWAEKDIHYEWVEMDSTKVNLATSTIKILKKLVKNQDKV